MKKIFFILTILPSICVAADETTTQKWTATPPSFIKDPGPWISLTKKLEDAGLYFSATVSASRMLIFFQNLSAKESAFKTIIRLIDRGYPYSTQHLFRSGDIFPQDDYQFVNSYNLYKAIVNQDSGMATWADNYFGTIDKENFSKYHFYKAMNAYSEKNYAVAEENLLKILAKNPSNSDLPFIRKVARTLARVYFDQKKYEKALDIYNSFLLQLNPMNPSDWLEAAWCLYHLKAYSKALGYLYNLESSAREPTINLEKYVIRALIYKDYCASQNTDQLIESFSKDFGPTIDGIRKGEPLSGLKPLQQIQLPVTALYRQYAEIFHQLRAEKKQLPYLSSEEATIYKYLIDTEERLLNQQIKATEDEALEKAASRLIMMYEQLKFLRYGVARQKFSPEAVFAETPDDRSSVEASGDNLRIRWQQLGDFWRDERLGMQGKIQNKCTK